MRSHTRQSIYRCGEDANGAVVDFRLPSSGNSAFSPNQASGNVPYHSLESMGWGNDTNVSD
jgi:hypothetical protein